MEGFFGQFRQIASSLDRNCNELKSTLDNPDGTSVDEKRSCLMLRQILGEVQNLKSDVNKESKAAQKKFQGDILAASIRLTQDISERISNLESHLQKYGYIKLQEDLPGPNQLFNSSESAHGRDSGSASEVEEHEDQFNGNSSDNDFIDDTHMTDEQENTPPHDINNQEEAETVIDPLKSPVRPATFTQMIDATPIKQDYHLLTAAGHDTPMCQTPEPPPTATPMISNISTFNRSDSPEITSMQSNTGFSPIRPSTATPMIKVHPKVNAIEDLRSESPVAASPQLPEAPVMATPGLQRYAEPSQSNSMGEYCESSQYSFMDEIPMAPEITSVKILQPDEIPESSLANSHLPCEIVSPLSEQEYMSLPVYVKGQFSFNSINYLILRTNRFLSMGATGESQPCMEEHELCEILQLGPRLKAFMLALAKVGRLSLSGHRIIFQSRN